MKDPLQERETPFEVLGIGPDATQEDIDRAFKAKLLARVNVQKLTAARKTLGQPLDRALVVLFEYRDTALSELSPNPVREVTALAAENRAATAASWIGSLRRSFPNPALTHVLAVFHYWWAIAETERLAGAARVRNTASVDPIWEMAIGAWASALADPTFWQQWPGIPADLRKELVAEIRQRLSGDLHRLVLRFHEAGSEEPARRLERLTVRCEDEFETARVMLEAGLTDPRGPRCAGKLLLDGLTMTDDVVSTVQGALQRKPGDQNLVFLSNALAHWAEIWFLLRRDHFEAAMAGIEKLAQSQRGTKEVRKLECQALHGLASQQAALKEWNKALDFWEKALAKADSDEDRLAIHAKIEKDLGNGSAEAVDDDSRDQWIGRLERAKTLLEQAKDAPGAGFPARPYGGLDGTARQAAQAEHARLAALWEGKHAPSADFLARLARLLRDRGVGRINRAQEDYHEDRVARAAAAKTAQSGVEDLERAKSLGSKQAAEDLPTAYMVLQAMLGNAVDSREPNPTPPQPAKPASKPKPASKAIPSARGWWAKLPSWLRWALQFVALILLAWWTTQELEIFQKNQSDALKSPVLNAVFWLAWLFLFIFPWNATKVIGAVTFALLVIGAAGHWVFKDRNGSAAPVAQQAAGATEAKVSVNLAPPGGKPLAPAPAPTLPAKSEPVKNDAQKEATKKEVAKTEPAQTASATSKAACPDLKALAKAETADERTRALQGLDKIADLGPDCRGKVTLSAVELATAMPSLAPVVRPWATLLAAASFEAIGDSKSALPNYQDLAASEGEFGLTGKVRASELGQPDRTNLERLYAELRAGTVAQAWFKTADGWQRSDSHRAANLGLLAVRGNDWSISLFERLHRLGTPWPENHRYLLVLAGVILAILMLELPLMVWSARLAAALGRLSASVGAIQRRHAGDPAAIRQQVAELYALHGVNPGKGCLVVFCEWALWVTAFYLFKDWIPRMELDAASFFWIGNVLQPDMQMLGVWWGAAALASFMTQQGSTGQRWFVALLFPLLIVGVAWYFGWPAYVMLAWAMLLLAVVFARLIVRRFIAQP